jgi:hypothetical protein
LVPFIVDSLWVFSDGENTLILICAMELALAATLLVDLVPPLGMQRFNCPIPLLLFDLHVFLRFTS